MAFAACIARGCTALPAGCPDRKYLGETVTFPGYEVVVSKFLAKGGCAFVYRAEDARRTPAEQYAVKRVVIQDADSLRVALDEMEYHLAVSSHPNVVRIYGCRVGDSVVQANRDSIRSFRSSHTDLSFPLDALILMEYCPGGNLVEIIRREDDSKFSPGFVARAFGHIISAVSAMHVNCFANRDLKLENILLACDTTGKIAADLTQADADAIRICDFGSCSPLYFPDGRIFGKDLRLSQRVKLDIEQRTTPMYRSPEMIDLANRFPLTFKSDVFTLGTMLYYMLYRELPFKNATLAIFNVNFTFPQDNPYPGTPFNSWIKRCYTKDPDARPTIWDVAKHVCAPQKIEYMQKPDGWEEKAKEESDNKLAALGIGGSVGEATLTAPANPAGAEQSPACLLLDFAAVGPEHVESTPSEPAAPAEPNLFASLPDDQKNLMREFMGMMQ